MKPTNIVRLGLVSVWTLCYVASAQTPRIWVLKPPNTIVEYDPATFAAKGTTSIPEAVFDSPAALQVNAKGQMLFALTEDDPTIDVSKGMTDKVWFWDGQKVSILGRGYLRMVAHVGSNQKVTESLPLPYLSANGSNLYWLTGQETKLQRDNVELEMTTMFQAWRTDLAGKQREDLTSFELPSCRCTTGVCQETCTTLRPWVPSSGMSAYFFLTRIIQGQIEMKYEQTSLYEDSNGNWSSAPVLEPLQKILDARENGSFVVSAVPDTGCCGWENQSNDQTLFYRFGKHMVIFDERARYKNPDYDVSFFTSSAKIAPDSTMVALTIQATGKPGGAVQLSEEGQANPQESERIRKVMTELPAVQIVLTSEGSKQLAYVPHASVAGWLSEKELLIVENGVLVAFTPSTGAKRKSGIKANDAAWIYVR